MSGPMLLGLDLRGDNFAPGDGTSTAVYSFFSNLQRDQQ